MISFVWSADHPFYAGRGGSENYTAGQIRELMRRGVPTRIITVGQGENDGRDGFPDITFTSVESKEELSELDDTLVFVTYPLNIRTKRQSYAILHCPPEATGKRNTLFDLRGFRGKKLLAPSKFAAKLWARELGSKTLHMPAVYPFAENAFAKAVRSDHTTDKTRILFAGRLKPDKGIYTLLAALHMPEMKALDYELTVTTAGNEDEDGQLIEPLVKAHPLINVVPARRNSEEMAELTASHDVVLMPSSNIFWKEIFGIVSVEAQHAGCRVVASNAGGIPETNCGGLTLVKPDDPKAFAIGIKKAAELGPLTTMERYFATSKFTVTQSVNKLLNIISVDEPQYAQYLLPSKHSGLVREQFDTALQSVSQLGLRLAGKK
jgi:D-inositol-3-phosphate glycosyltransferase